MGASSIMALGGGAVFIKQSSGNVRVNSEILNSGEFKPLAWNDEGIYDYFYIDFKSPVSDFSVGMLSESIIVHDSEQLTVMNQIRISASVFKLYVNIAGKYQGVSVLNKIMSNLYFTSGERIPPFSIHFFVSGIIPYIRLKYIYDYTHDPILAFLSLSDNIPTFAMHPNIVVNPWSENCALGTPIEFSATTENTILTLI